MLSWSRYTGLLFAIGLAIGEAVINWGHWQYAPLWVVDYLCVAWLVAGFVATRTGNRVPLLLSGWAFTAGVFYMGLFVSLEPQLRAQFQPPAVLLFLMGGMLAVSVVGIATSALALKGSGKNVGTNTEGSLVTPGGGT